MGPKGKGWRGGRAEVRTQDKVWTSRYHQSTHPRETIEADIQRVYGRAAEPHGFTFRHVQLAGSEPGTYLDICLGMVDTIENRARLDTLPHHLSVPDLARLEKVGFGAGSSDINPSARRHTACARV